MILTLLGSPRDTLYSSQQMLPQFLFIRILSIYIFRPTSNKLMEKPLIQGSHFYPNTKFSQSLWSYIPGTFIQILVIKISKCVKTDARFRLLLWHKIPYIFQVKAMKSKVTLASNQCWCWKCRYDKKVNQNYFCKWHFEKWSLKLEFANFKFFPLIEQIQVIFQVWKIKWRKSRFSR